MSASLCSDMEVSNSFQLQIHRDQQYALLVLLKFLIHEIFRWPLQYILKNCKLTASSAVSSIFFLCSGRFLVVLNHKNLLQRAVFNNSLLQQTLCFR